MLQLDDILQEVSAYAPKKLREIENTFSQLKKSQNNKNARLLLIKQIKEFTRIPEVVLFFDNEYNAGIVTVYKEATIRSVVETTLNMFTEKPAGKKIEPSDLRKLNSIAEPEEMIKRIYVYIGKPLIKVLTPSEMVAVLLHEFGHVYSSATDIPRNTLQFLTPLLNYSIIGKFILLKTGIIQMTTQLSFLYNIMVLAFVHGVTFTERMEELKSDNYAAKYGYGDELLLALNKFHTTEKGKPSKINFFKKILKELFSILLKILMPKTYYTHPDYSFFSKVVGLVEIFSYQNNHN